MTYEEYDVAIIGAGAAGLSAAAVTAAAGRSTLVIDREDFPGGILRQCIHNGFGLRYFKKELTGPEYAEMVVERANLAGAKYALGNTVTQFTKLGDKCFELTMLSAMDGLRKVRAKAVMLAMGCRERNRGNLATPGTRPAGLYTAGSAQRLLNMEGMLPGKSAVIVGSGDIGLIMARRLRWSGIEVKAVIEIMPFPSGLTRNVVQCLNDFNIPLYLSHSVIRICGKDRVEGVDVAPLEQGQPDVKRKFHINCDTVLFSVGLVPENELAVQAGVELNPATGGALVDANYETNVKGVFSAGNVLHVHDLVDFVSEEAGRAAERMLAYLDGREEGKSWRVSVGANLKYAVPTAYFANRNTVFSFRPLIVTNGGELTAELNGQVIWKKKLPFVRPAEMIAVELPASMLTGGELVFKLAKGE